MLFRSWLIRIKRYHLLVKITTERWICHLRLKKCSGGKINIFASNIAQQSGFELSLNKLQAFTLGFEAKFIELQQKQNELGRLTWKHHSTTEKKTMIFIIYNEAISFQWMTHNITEFTFKVYFKRQRINMILPGTHLYVHYIWIAEITKQIFHFDKHWNSKVEHQDRTIKFRY